MDSTRHKYSWVPSFSGISGGSDTRGSRAFVTPPSSIVATTVTGSVTCSVFAETSYGYMAVSEDGCYPLMPGLSPFVLRYSVVVFGGVWLASSFGRTLQLFTGSGERIPQVSQEACPCVGWGKQQQRLQVF